jgi:transposase-like protein
MTSLTSQTIPAGSTSAHRDHNRGVAVVCMVVCDGLKGLSEAVNAVWDRAVIQACVIHLLRNTFRFTSGKYWYEIARDIRPVYTRRPRPRPRNASGSSPRNGVPST